MYTKAFHNKDISQLSFLVTGGAGFIGSHIVEYLLKHGAKKVRVLDNLLTGSIDNVNLFTNHPNYEFLKGDIRDFKTCLKACEGIDLISHQAALGSVPRSIDNPMATTEINVDGFVNMLKAAHDSGIKRFVYASSSSVYGDELTLPKQENKIGKCLSPYAASKMANEIYSQAFGNVYGVELIGFRYFNVFGPRQSPTGPYAAVIPLFVQGLLQNRPVYVNGDGLQTRDFTFVANAVQANIKGMLTDNPKAVNEAYNVAIGERFSILQLFDDIAQLLGSEQKAIHRDPRAGDVRDSLADVSKANDLLGYQPEVRFEDGLLATVKYFKEVYNKRVIV